MLERIRAKMGDAPMPYVMPHQYSRTGEFSKAISKDQYNDGSALVAKSIAKKSKQSITEALRDAHALVAVKTAQLLSGHSCTAAR